MKFGEQSISYNAIGCPTSYRGNTLTWANGTQLTQYDTTSFEYDGYGRRIQKGNIIYTYSADGTLLKTSDGLEFVYDQSGLVGFKNGTTNYVYRKNLQGDVTAILNAATGAVVTSYAYDAWGNHTVSGDATLGELNPFRYRGYLYDVETGLYYLKSRYYDPQIGRFISQDEISYLDPATINGLNLFAYCGNNPVMRTDSNGNNWWSDFWNSTAGSVLKTIGSALLIAGGIALCFVPGAQLIGAGLIVWGAGGIIGGIVGAATGYGYGNGWDIGNFIGMTVGLIVAMPQLSGLTLNIIGGGGMSFALAGGGAVAGATVMTIAIGNILIGVAEAAIAIGGLVMFSKDPFVKHLERKMSENQKEQFQREIEDIKHHEGRGGADNLTKKIILDIYEWIMKFVK
jgi:RHS repeat-associated protein